MEVFTKVYLGDKSVAQDLEFIKENNISHVLNMTPSIKNFFDKNPKETLKSSQESKNLSQEDQNPNTEEIKQEEKIPDYSITYLRVPIDDSINQNIKQHFDNCINFMNQSTSGTLVHCKEGRSRSVSIIIAYSMKVLKMSLKESYEHLEKLTERYININDGFKRQLMEYEKEVFGIGENSINLMPQRKRVRNYNEDQFDYDFEEEYVQVKPRKKKIVEKGEEIELYKPQLGKEKEMRQPTLFEFLKIKAQEKKKEKVVKKVETKKQMSILSFFSKK